MGKLKVMEANNRKMRPMVLSGILHAPSEYGPGIMRGVDEKWSRRRERSGIA